MFPSFGRLSISFVKRDDIKSTHFRGRGKARIKFYVTKDNNLFTDLRDVISKSGSDVVDKINDTNGQFCHLINKEKEHNAIMCLTKEQTMALFDAIEEINSHPGLASCQ